MPRLIQLFAWRCALFREIGVRAAEISSREVNNLRLQDQGTVERLWKTKTLSQHQ